jgi:glycosyltransferase involved in cell wall biosynthesis
MSAQVSDRSLSLRQEDGEFPRISIVIPVFNGSNYMREAIESALAQTWANTEVIVVNDGSSDGGETDRIARSYGDRIVYVNKLNGGVASALNAGIEAMSGHVFCWLSHDDIHLPTKSEEQVKFWRELGCPNDLVLYSDYTLIDARGEWIADVALDHEMLESKPLYSILRGSVHGCSIFVPRELFREVGTFDTERPTTQDYDLWFRMTKHARFTHMDKILIKSRWHDEQGSKKIDHFAEANALWSGIMREVSKQDREVLEGSEYKFFKELEVFLRKNKIHDAAADAAQLAEDIISQTLVSVVVPVFNRPEQAVSAINSARSQTHSEIEIIVVDDGSSIDMSLVERTVSGDPKVKLLRQENKGAAAARNLGLTHARGEYVAFLDSDDLFLPEKVAAQIREMARDNYLFSHTSYWLRRRNAGFLEAKHVGTFGGDRAFPEIIATCGIATPTVMLHRKLLQEFRFSENLKIGEDVVLWIRIAARNGVHGMDRLMTIVRAGAGAAAYDEAKQLVGLNNILDAVRTDPFLSRFETEISRLERDAASLAAATERTVPSYAA